MPGAEPSHVCSLSPPPESIGDPISNSGFEISINYVHLLRQSALLKSHCVKSSVTGPPSRPYATCSDVTNASTAETFSANFTLPSSFAFAWFVTRFGGNFLSVPEFQAVQFSVFILHRFITTGMMIAIFPSSLEQSREYDCS